MAENKNTITVKFKPEGDKDLVNAIKTLGRETRKLVQTQASLAREGKKVKNTQDKLTDSQKKAATQTRILGGTFAVLRSKMLLFNFAMGLGIRQVVLFAKEASRVESMERAFNTLSGGIEDSSFALKQLKEATNNTMSEFDLFRQANNAMILGVTKNSDEMAEMFDIAQRLGRALGRDTASSVESLITGIGRQSRLMLDNIGIIVKSEEAYEAYAKKLGITTKELTDTDKKTAFLEATMESAREKVATLGKESLTTQDNFDQLSTSFTNFTTALTRDSVVLKSTSNLLSNILDTVTERLLTKPEGIDALLQNLNSQKAVLESANKMLNDLNPVNNQGASVQAALAKNRISQIEAELQALAEIAFANKKIEDSKKKIAEATRIQALAEEFLSEMLKKNYALEIRRAELSDPESVKSVDLIEKNALALDFLNTEQKFAVDSINQLGGAFAQAAVNGQNMGEAVTSSLKAIAAQLIAQAGTYALLNIFTGGAFATGLGGGLGGFLRFAVGHTGGLIKQNGDIQRFATGGQVQGQDNVPILAQAGEFIMSKKAVESVGLETMNQINQSGNASPTVNVNISGGVVDESYVNNELIPALNKATSMGNRINA
tara:strand:- start:16875 stop:18689 length:1815 start_codon:yes stop_codon:yes gene_type:complete